MPLVNPRIVVSSTIGVVIQLALTILAWGDWSTYFAHPARTWLVIGSFLLLIAAWFTGTSGVSGGIAHSSASKTILYGFGAVILAEVVVPPFCDRREIWVIDGDPVRYFGLILFFQWIGRHSIGSPAQDGWPLSLYPASELHRATRFHDWLRAHLSQRDWTAPIRSTVPTPSQPHE
jgi:hypothetical protein